MRWAYFIIALLLVLVLQTGVVAFLGRDWLDLLLALALFYGLTAPAPDARLAGLCTGLAQDVRTGGPMGVHALALGLAGLLLTYFREQVNRHVWWARWVIASIAGLAAQFVVLLHQSYVQHLGYSWGYILLSAALTALVSGLLAALAAGVPHAVRRRRRFSAARW